MAERRDTDDRKREQVSWTAGVMIYLDKGDPQPTDGRAFKRVQVSDSPTAIKITSLAMKGNPKFSDITTFDDTMWLN